MGRRATRATPDVTSATARFPKEREYVSLPATPPSLKERLALGGILLAPVLLVVALIYATAHCPKTPSNGRGSDIVQGYLLYKIIQGFTKH